MNVAHRGDRKRENTVGGVLDVIGSVDMVEIDVRYSTDRRVVLCHDREHRNHPCNDTLDTLMVKLAQNKVPGARLMIDIKAFGMTESKKLARDVSRIVKPFDARIDLWLCSFNEYCVDELLNFRDDHNGRYRVGVISAGIPLGMFDHLAMDFVSLDYGTVCEDIMSRMHERGLVVFAWVVNDASMKRMMLEYGVDGIICDINK